MKEHGEGSRRKRQPCAPQDLMIRKIIHKVGCSSYESEVAVNRFEGHGARHAFRPKVNGWSEGTEWDLRSNMRIEAIGEILLWQQTAQNSSR